MTDRDNLREVIARATYEGDDPWHSVWPWPDLQEDQVGPEKYREIADAILSALDAAGYAVVRVDDAAVEPVACCDSAGRCTFACEFAHPATDSTAAMIEGARLALEAAAKMAGEYNAWSYVHNVDGVWQPGSPFDHGQEKAARHLATTIRALDPAQIVKDATDGR